jgi:hypothetical protein
MANEITLPVDATVEPDTCGSCKFFRRKSDNPYYVAEGWCVIELPPPKERFAPKPYVEGNGDEYRAPNITKDTSRCDLQRPDGKSYIVQRRVG